MKKIYFSILLLTSAIFVALAVEPARTDLPAAYGEQLWISTFDGAWETTNNEPVTPTNGGGWHSFNTMEGAGTAGNLAKNTKQFNFDTGINNVRPMAAGDSKSGKVTTNTILGTVANGNITTGQIYANVGVLSSSADSKNMTKCYNKGVKSDSKYNTPFESKPDSVAVWVNFAPISATQYGRMSIFIYGEGAAGFQFQDPPSTVAIRDQVVAFAGKEFLATGGWVRLSVPFQYDNYDSFTNFTNSTLETNTTTYQTADVAPKYIIATMATNKIPGGNANDVLWVDDFLMIYNPALTAENTSGKSVFAPADVLSVAYTLTGTMSPYNLNAASNVVSLELSDASGAFDAPTVLDYKETNESGAFSIELPGNLENGTGYKVRVVTTNYPMISETLSISVVSPAIITTSATNNDDLGCNPASIIPPSFTVTDYCNASAEANISTDGPTHTACSYSQTWTASYTSECGTATPLSITYHWVQNAPAIITTSATDNDDLGLNPTVVEPEFTVTDECNPSAVATVTTEGPTNIGDNFTQTWTANYTPECGSAATPVSITYHWVKNDGSSLGRVVVENTVFVYPNPVSKTLFVECAGAEKAAVYTLNGIKIATTKVTESGINVSDYAKGLYLIVVETKDGCVHRSLFVKE